ncbi:MAG: DUF2169 domain-containing protein [Polyangiaceae bacterium]
MSIRWPVPISADAHLAAGTMRWSSLEKTFVTVVAKVTLELDPTRRQLRLTAPTELAVRDQALKTPKAWRPADVAPFSPMAEVVLRASAWQPQGATGTTRAVRFGVYRGQSPLFSKVLHVYGDRRADAPRMIEPFTRMPIVWERAIGDATNPLGPGPDAAVLPNVVYPQSPGVAGGFGAIPRYFPVRERMVESLGRDRADSLVSALPPQFDFRYYQSAPLDQRVAALAGNEWLVLEGMHPVHQSLSLELPGVRAAANLITPRGTTSIGMQLALVFVDLEDGAVTLTFRGASAVSPTEPIACVATIEQAGALAAWPAAPALASSSDAPSALTVLSVDSTLPISAAAQARVESRAVTPFEEGSSNPRAPTNKAATPWDRPLAPAPSAANVDETLAPAPPKPPAVASALPEPRPAAKPGPSTPPPAPPPPTPPNRANRARPRPEPMRRRPRSADDFEAELLGRGLPREDVAAIVAAVRSRVG